MASLQLSLFDPELQLGKHVFKLKATGPTGLTSSKPAVKTFRVVAPARPR